MMFDEEAILYYADHPVEFVEDIIGATPDEEQAKILRSVAQNQMTSVRSGVSMRLLERRRRTTRITRTRRHGEIYRWPIIKIRAAASISDSLP